MAKEDFYKLLGVDKGIDAAGLKSAYRKLAMQYHPDRNPDNPEAEEKFKGISEAYDILKDEQKRAAYDRFGHSAFDGTGGMGGGQGGGFRGDPGSGFSDIFDDLFGDFTGRGVAAAVDGASKAAALTCATIWTFRSKKRLPGRRQPSGFQALCHVTTATAPAQKLAPAPRFVRPVLATARSGLNKAFLPSSAPARPVMARAASSTNRASRAQALAGLKKTVRSM